MDGPTDGSVLIDCRSCPARGRYCGDCVVPTLFLDAPGLPLDALERRAVGAFVAAGLLGAAEATALCARADPWGGSSAVG